MGEAELLTRAECERIFGTVTSVAHIQGVSELEVMIGAGANALTRFANNTIHQNVAERGHYISVRPVIDGRTARANANSLKMNLLVTSEAISITRLQMPDPDLPPLAEPSAVAPASREFRSTAAAAPMSRARAVKEAIDVAESAGLTAAGIYSTNHSVFAILNSRGLFDYHTETMAQFSITAMGPDSSGWAKA